MAAGPPWSSAPCAASRLTLTALNEFRILFNILLRSCGQRKRKRERTHVRRCRLSHMRLSHTIPILYSRFMLRIHMANGDVFGSGLLRNAQSLTHAVIRKNCCSHAGREKWTISKMQTLFYQLVQARMHWPIFQACTCERTYSTDCTCTDVQPARLDPHVPTLILARKLALPRLAHGTKTKVVTLTVVLPQRTCAVPTCATRCTNSSTPEKKQTDSCTRAITP